MDDDLVRSREGSGADPDDKKRLKVKIPVSQHIKLHSVRLLHDQTLSESVRRALDHYFDVLADEEEGVVREEAAS